MYGDRQAIAFLPSNTTGLREAAFLTILFSFDREVDILINEIYLRRSRKVIVAQESDQLPSTYLATAIQHITELGFIFSPALTTALSSLSINSFTQWFDHVFQSLKMLVGADVDYNPMYPNFPEQVMEASITELYFNALLHYYSGELPQYKALQRTALAKNVHLPAIEKLQLIELGDEVHFRGIITGLIASNTSISQVDKNDVVYAIEHENELELLLPQQIPYKEQAALVAATLIRCSKGNASFIAKYIHTATDVLRLAVSLSHGDISLAKPTHFRKFKRAERRMLLELLERCPVIAEDMLRYASPWIRLGEILHPGEYKERYPRCYEAFDIIRNNRVIEKFNSAVERALQAYDSRTAVQHLLARPGEFARRLDHLLRISSADDAKWVLTSFEGVRNAVATPLLLQLMTHFKKRHVVSQQRVFFPKGNVAKAFSLEDSRYPIAQELCNEVISLCEQALLDHFAKLPPLGNVYIDEQLQHYIVPFSQRSASKALHTLVRGSKLSMSEGDTIRFFLWWKEGVTTGRVDIDLSAILYDDDWRYMEHISYTNLRSAKYKAAHSGDIVTAPDGACEFIDIDIPSVLAYGGRYVVATLHSFTGQVYCDLPQCFAGWMMRQHPQSGEVFEPTTVANRVDLAANTQIAIPVVLDLKERTIIWCDLALTSQPNYYNNVEGHQSGIVLMGKAMSDMQKCNLYDLFRLHAMARGTLVENEEAADIIYSPERGVTPFDIEMIMSEYIASEKC